MEFPQSLTSDQELNILNFQAMTECKNAQQAEELLRTNNWDVTSAAQQYLASETAYAMEERNAEGRYEDRDIYGGGQTYGYRPNVSEHFPPGSGGAPPSSTGEQIREGDEYRSEALIPDYGGWGGHGGYYHNGMGHEEEISLGGALIDGLKIIGGGIKTVWNWTSRYLLYI